MALFTPPDAYLNLFYCGPQGRSPLAAAHRLGPSNKKTGLSLAVSIEIDEKTLSLSGRPTKGRYMKTRQIAWLTSLILSSLLPGPLPAASREADTPNTLPIWLRVFRSYPPTSRDVFNAFHSSAPINASAMPGALVGSSGAAHYPDEFRSVDGRNNAPGNLGLAGTINLRNTTVGYSDGSGTPAGADRKGAREISNIVNAQTGLIANSDLISGFVWNWGNIVDHDMVLTRVSNPVEPFDISVPTGDPVFDPRGRGNVTLHFNRSNSTVVDGIREQINANTAFLDGSLVYGSEIPRARALRTEDGTGHLKTGDNNLLPLNVDRLPNQPTNDPSFFLAGDTRSNENLALCAVQTLLMREHNFWADTIKAGDPTLDDEGIYLRARAIVGAEIQLITYRDFVPILLGPDALTPYAGYNLAVDPRVSLAFSTAAFRVGHTFLPPVFMRLNQRNRSVGDVLVQKALFEPQLITKIGIEPYLRGLANQIPQQVDGYVIDAVRNFTAGTTSSGFDLAALNIQRGRDHGLPGYNQVRIDYGLAPKATFAEMTSNLEFQTRLASAYTSPDDTDFWVGGIIEDHVNGGQVGETFAAIFKDQFERTRDGDRFWYESYLDSATLATVQAQTLGIIIKRNTTIGSEMQDDAFHMPVAR